MNEISHLFAVGFWYAHAPTMLRLNNKILLCWHGKRLKTDYQDLFISEFKEGEWSKPRSINLTSISTQFENCWNPVLFKQAESNDICLFFKTGSLGSWKGHALLSRDDGETWSQPFALAGDSIGPTKNPPLELDNGVVLMPSSRVLKHRTFVCFQRFNLKIGEIQEVSLDDKNNEALFVSQPALIKLPDNSILALCRSNSGFIFKTSSHNEGIDWLQLKKTELLNPNSAIATLTVEDGYYLAMNPSSRHRAYLWILFFPWKRVDDPLYLFQLFDGGNQLSYPSLIALNERSLLISYSINQQNIQVKQLNLSSPFDFTKNKHVHSRF